MPDADTSLTVDVLDQSRHVGVLRDAAADRKVVRMVYRSVGKEETTERDVEPWSVFTTLGRWYVLGHCRLVDGQRTFRVDRVKELSVLDEEFERPDSVPEPRVGYAPSKDDITCVIDLKPAARWVLEYYPVEVVRESSRTIRIRFHSPDAEVPARLLLRLGADGKLVEGPEVTARLAAIGQAVLDRHQ
jgi:proteasome accessory factor C